MHIQKTPLRETVQPIEASTPLPAWNLCRQAENTRKGAHRVFEGVHDVVGQVDVLKHALQLIGELAAALGLELGDHGLLRVAAGAAPQQQPLGQVLLVEGLENVLALLRHRERLSGNSIPTDPQTTLGGGGAVFQMYLDSRELGIVGGIRGSEKGGRRGEGMSIDSRMISHGSSSGGGVMLTSLNRRSTIS